MSEQTKDLSMWSCANFAPAGFQGHWRDWHRGHGCGLDPLVAPVVPPTPQEPSEPKGRGYTLQSLSNYFGWGVRDDRDIWLFAFQRESLLRLCQSLLHTEQSTASTAELAIRERIEQLDALRAENTRLRKVLAPFGALADAYDPPEDDNDDITWHRKPTLGQLRAARAALTP